MKSNDSHIRNELIPLLFIVIEIQLAHLLSELLMGTSICDDRLIPIDPCFIRELFDECIAYFLGLWELPWYTTTSCVLLMCEGFITF
jgi:hypothetical protein